MKKISFAVAIFNYTTGVNDSLVVKKTKLSTLPKFGSLRGSSSASLNIWGQFWKLAKNLIEFSMWGRTYFSSCVVRSGA